MFLFTSITCLIHFFFRSEYWKSIPKKYCDVCKVWYHDNRASIEHHERGLRHKANVQKKLIEIRRKGVTEQREQESHRLEMMKIEAAALNSFQKDIGGDPSLATELSTASSSLKHLPAPASSSTSTAFVPRGRFGEDAVPEEESRELVRGRERALETVASKLEKRSRWLEARTAEGDVYYWNRQTFGKFLFSAYFEYNLICLLNLETVREKPKSGFLSLAEQESSAGTGILPVVPLEYTSTDSSAGPYGSWQPVEHNQLLQMPDLQLPENENAESADDVEPVIPPELREEVKFEEKVISKKLAPSNETFKKRNVAGDKRRNVRKRESSP